MANRIKGFSQYIKESHEPHIEPSWQIDDYEKDPAEDTLTVYCYDPEKPEETDYLVATFSLSDLENWIEKHVDLTWSQDYYDPQDFYGHGQDSGELTPEEWWDSADVKEIHNTIKKFMLESGISPE